MKRTAKPVSDPSFDRVPKRVVVKRDDDIREDMLYDGCVLYYSTHPDFISDLHAECPVNDDGTTREGVIWFPVSAYIHSGVHWELGTGDHFPDRQFDRSFMGYIYTNRKIWESLVGQAWMYVFDQEKKEYVSAKDRAEFVAYVRKCAESRIATMNLVASGDVYRYVVEEATPFRIETTNLVTNEVMVEVHNKYVVVDSCGMFVTDKLDEINFPRFDDNGIEIPVFYENDVYTGTGYNARVSVLTTEGNYYLTENNMWCSDLKKAAIFPSSLVYEHMQRQADRTGRRIRSIKLTEEQEKERGIE